MRRLLYIGAVLITIAGLGVWAFARANARVEKAVAQLCGDDAKRAELAEPTVKRMGRRAVKPLATALRECGPGPVQDRIAKVLGEIGDPRAAGPLFQAAQLGCFPAAQALDVNLGNPRAKEALALAYCARGERLLRDVERALPVAQTWADALAAAARDSSHDTEIAQWLQSQPGPSFYMGEALMTARQTVATATREAERLFDRAIRVHPTPRAVRGLYRAQELAPDACLCASDVTKAKRDPRIAAVINEHRRRLERIAELAEPILRPRAAEKIRSVVRLRGHGSGSWHAAALIDLPYGHDAYGYQGVGALSFYDDVSAVVFDAAASRLGLTRTVRRVRVWKPCDLSGVWCAADDLDGDGRSEILLTAEDGGDYWSRNPCYLLVVYTWDGRRLRELFRGHGELPVVVNDLDGDGDKEIVFAYAAARSLYPGQAPMWPMTYTLKNGEYVPSNQEYVQLYRDALPDFERAVRIAPKDGKVLDCLARIHRILGRKQQALKVFKVALAAYKQGGTWGDIGRIAVPRVQQNIKQLEAELKAAGEAVAP